ncbi:cyclophilin-like fold protein [Anaerotruncus colihominis]|uniref:cyclophilin-like fold protein n=1 Tax=Anaerotruncus colihominis TaxID=169435 RepID=UPI001FAE61EE|nr:cyclophilin-like fold protein [Anaerotruncus colihominis]
MIPACLSLLLAFALVACGDEGTNASLPSPADFSAPSYDTASSSPQEELLEDISFVPEQGEPRVEEGANLNGTKKIRFLVDGEEMIVLLNGNPSAEALYEMLPLELTFEDFNHTEKIAYLDKELPTEGSPNSWDPAVGDLCFYIPWGNLCFFYQDFRYSESLVPLGTVESGAESLEQLSGVSHVIAEAAE